MGFLNSIFGGKEEGEEEVEDEEDKEEDMEDEEDAALYVWEDGTLELIKSLTDRQLSELHMMLKLKEEFDLDLDDEFDKLKILIKMIKEEKK